MRSTGTTKLEKKERPMKSKSEEKKSNSSVFEEVELSHIILPPDRSGSNPVYVCRWQRVIGSSDQHQPIERHVVGSNAMCLQIVDIAAYNGFVSKKQDIDFVFHCD